MQQLYEPMASSVLQATFPPNCSCLHMVVTGNAMESLVTASVAQICPLLILVLGIKPTVPTDGTIMVTEKAHDVWAVSRRYSRLLIFYTGDAPLRNIDDTLAMLLVVQHGTNFIITEPISGWILGQWNPDAGLILRDRSPWLDYATQMQMRRISSLRVSLFECPPYVTYKRININGTEAIQFDGIEVRIVREAMCKMNITFLPQDASVWGNTSKGPWERIVEDVAEHRADVAVCSLWLTAQSPVGLQMSAPWTRQKGTFLVPKSWPLSPATMLYLPLKLWTWVVLLNATLIFILILYSISRMLPSGEGCQYHSLCICLLDTFRMLMLNSCPRFPQQAALRYLLTSWAFFSLLTMTTYSTGYTSLFTSPPFSPPINTVDDLLYQGIYWGERSNDFKLLFLDSGNPKLAEFGKRFKPEMSELDREKRILQGHYAVFTKAMSSMFVTETEKLSYKSRQKLRIMKESVFTFYVAIGLCPNLPFKSHIDRTIMRLQDAGIVSYWQSLTIQNLGYHYMSTFFEVSHEKNTDHSALSLNSMQGAFCVLGMGLALSCISWFLEIRTGHRNNMCTMSTYTKT